MSEYPTGTVTFLFTDIEGSTKLSQQYPGAMPGLLTRHNEILNQAVESHIRIMKIKPAYVRSTAYVLLESHPRTQIIHSLISDKSPTLGNHTYPKRNGDNPAGRLLAQLVLQV
jgi:DNA-binding sugar fermentation-stimulating protein